METNRENFSSRVRILDFGEQGITKLTRLKAHVVVAASKASTELETFHFSQHQRSLDENGQTVVQPWNHRESGGHPNPAGVHLMNGCIPQAETLHRRDILIGHLGKRIDLLKKHDVRLDHG